MIDPANLKTVEVKDTNTSIVKMDYIPECELKVYDIYDDKGFKKYIEDIEKCVRRSFEYKRFIKYIRENMNMDEDIFLDDVKMDKSFKVKIEQHHTPFTLYDIVLIVFNKRMFYNEDISVRQVAKEVTRLHYRLIVGLIPLSQTTHELVHEQYLFIPVDKILGDYNKFVDEYKSFMTPEQLDTLNRIEEFSKTCDVNKYAKAILQHTLKLECQGTYKLPDLQQITNTMYNRIETIRDNGYRLPTIQEEQQLLIDKYQPQKEEAIYFF